mmetsp:Transcript_12913/g.36330  ORF Transcript_12913/g.36330 Transcript_12913/m.36330 type:complete len:496 (-) Transcript_12913:42-1529(-)
MRDSDNVSAADEAVDDLESVCNTDTTLESDAALCSSLPFNPPLAEAGLLPHSDGSHTASNENSPEDMVGGAPDKNGEAKRTASTLNGSAATGGGGMQSGYEAGECDSSDNFGRSELDAFMDGLGLGVSSLLPSGEIRTEPGSESSSGHTGGASNNSTQQPPAGPRHLSAKQRRQMQKEGAKAPQVLQDSAATPAPIDATTTPVVAPEAAEDEEAAAIAAARAAEAQRKAAKKEAMDTKPPPQNQRGKKAKAKKIKAKYGDQDEEDRELAMQLLASAGQKVHHRQARKEKKAAKQFTSQVPQPELPDGLTPAQLAEKISGRSKQGAQQGGQLNRVGSGLGGGNEPAAESVVVTTSQRPANGARAESQEVAELLAEENIVDLSEADREKLTELDSLTGMPRVEDILLFCVPVCAPYSALNGYKFRVKLTPGREKKGKAAKTAMAMFGQTADVSLREKDLLRAVTDTEAVAGMVGPVHVSMPGLSAAKASQRKAKKGR